MATAADRKLDGEDRADPLGMLKLLWKFFFDKPAFTRPRGSIPVKPMTREGLLAAPDRTLWRLGHSTVLLKLQGAFWLTDPVFCQRASPVAFAGPKRFHPTPISVDDLPPIHAVLLSHDHYDHLDRAAIRKLAHKTSHFLVPQGVGEILIGWGIDRAKVKAFAWWQETEIATGAGTIKLAFTPTQHFSGRSLWNRNQTLFGSWVIHDGDFRIFYSGDSGYFEGFQAIGAKYGPFDVTLIENGAYNHRWRAVHMLPEETAQAHRDLRGRWLIPIHNGTFDLALHPWTDPMERIQELAARNALDVCTPRFGEAVTLHAMSAGDCWWRVVDGADAETAAHPVLGEPSYEEKL
jgi:L-ascorbate metabolism protein UlaG (beta-lactamase superfamily)